MTDLKAFTRDLVGQMESDLGSRLDWVAIAHGNSDRSKPEHEIRSALAREVEAERWTRLDAAIRMAARLDNPGVDDPQARRLAIRPSAEAGAHGARHGCRARP